MSRNTTDQESLFLRSFSSSKGTLWSYPLFDYASAYRIKLMKEFLDDIKGKKAIDIGCGNGSISLLLWRLGAEVHSIDISKEALHVNRSLRNLNERSAQFEPNLCQSNAMKLPYKEETFDIACCLETLEFVTDDIPAIKEIERVTKVDGKVILFIPYDARITYEKESVGYYRGYSFKTMKKKLCSGQLRIERIIFWYFPMLKLLDMIKLRYIFGVVGLLVGILNDKNNSYKNHNLRDRSTFTHSLMRFYRTKIWQKAILPLLMNVLNVNKLFQNSPYSDARRGANDVFVILRKANDL